MRKKCGGRENNFTYGGNMDKKLIAISLLAIMAFATVLAYKSLENFSNLNLDSLDFGDEDDQDFDL